MSSLLRQFTDNSSASDDKMSFITLAAVAISVLVFPLAGWLADVYVGRYQMISACLKIMWLGAILFSIKSVLQSSKYLYLEEIAILLLIIGLGGFQANIIQFSLDQLFDSSSFEITSFILFYVWSYFAADLAVHLAYYCVCDILYRSIAALIVPLILTLAVSSDFLFRHWLVKEPVSHNPLKLIVQVLRYAAKNKYPRQRSAFTYWDDKHYSRIDLAKSIYGGPFTTEEVEDVKTFFQILVVVIVVCFFFGVPVNSNKISHSAVLLSFGGIPKKMCKPTWLFQVACLGEWTIGSFCGRPALGIFSFSYSVEVYNKAEVPEEIGLRYDVHPTLPHVSCLLRCVWTSWSTSCQQDFPLSNV